MTQEYPPEFSKSVSSYERKETKSMPEKLVILRNSTLWTQSKVSVYTMLYTLILKFG